MQVLLGTCVGLICIGFTHAESFDELANEQTVATPITLTALASNGSNSAHKSWSDSLKTQKDALKNHNKADSKDEKNELKTAFTKADEGKTVEIEDGKVKLDGHTWYVRWVKATHLAGSAKIVHVETKPKGKVRLDDKTEFENPAHTHGIRILGIPGWLIGVVLSVFGSFCSIVGLLLMKHSDNMGETELPLYKRWRWWSGLIVLVVLASVIDIPCLSLASLSLLAPLAGVSILLSSLFSHFGFLSVKDELDTQAKGSILVIWTGVTVTSIFGPHDDVKLTYTDMIDRLSEPSFLSAVGGTAVLALALVGLHFYMQRAATSDPKLQSRAAAMHSVAYGFISAAFGAYTQLLLKILSTCVRAAVVNGSGVFKTAKPYIILATIAFTAPSQLTAMNHSMRANLFWLSNSIYLSLLILCSTFTGAFFFDEFVGFEGRHLAFFSLGVTVTIVGLVLLYMRPSGPKEGVESEGEKQLLKPEHTDVQ